MRDPEVIHLQNRVAALEFEIRRLAALLEKLTKEKR